MATFDKFKTCLLLQAGYYFLNNMDKNFVKVIDLEFGKEIMDSSVNSNENTNNRMIEYPIDKGMGDLIEILSPDHSDICIEFDEEKLYDHVMTIPTLPIMLIPYQIIKIKTNKPLKLKLVWLNDDVRRELIKRSFIDKENKLIVSGGSIHNIFTDSHGNPDEGFADGLEDIIELTVYSDCPESK
jgi:hypothetical protein